MALGGKKGKEVGVPPASTDQNTGELSSDESSDESTGSPSSRLVKGLD